MVNIPRSRLATKLHAIVTIKTRSLWQTGHMSEIKNAVIDGSLVAVAAPVIGKSREIALATKAAHGTMLKLDTHIVKDAFKHNIKGTVTAGVCAGLAFATLSWVSRVMGAQSEQSATIKHSSAPNRR